MSRFLLLLTICLSTVSYAANIPSDALGAQKYDAMKCVDENYQICIQNQCLTSEEIDCQENCRTLSQQKCNQQGN